MPTYLSPGVYVEEIPSGSAPIAGVGTSTAGFIGIIEGKPANASTGDISSSESPTESQIITVEVDIVNDTGSAGTVFSLPIPEDIPAGATLGIPSEDEGGHQGEFTVKGNARSSFEITIDEAPVITFTTGVDADAPIKGSYKVKVIPPEETVESSPELINGQLDDHYWLNVVSLGKVGVGDGTTTQFEINDSLNPDFKVMAKVGGKNYTGAITLSHDEASQKTTLNFNPAPSEGAIFVEYAPQSIEAGVVKLCTNFSEFKANFGDFLDPAENVGQNTLAHAVYGFFRNGGTRCYVVWVNGEDKVSATLEEQFEAIDEIAIVAAPGASSLAVTGAVVDHCSKMGDRFAILDSPQTVDKLSDLDANQSGLPGYSDYAAVYYPWLKVYDPTLKAEKAVPPSGHMAGIYARVDTQRGVHKAPANEPVLGAVGLTYALSKAKQDGLNPRGVNCIRNLNGNFLVWGARTWGGDGNGEFKYISTRRLFNFLRESIDEGTQWTVFEPNSPELWAAIRRNVSAFLTLVWRSGALFGNTPEQAFYVKCDEETNPLAIREQGRVVTEIGVAVVKPAEFVIFRLSQWAGGQG